MKKYFFLSLSILTLLTLQVLPSRVEAQSNQAVFQFFPNTGSFSLNDTFSIDLRINSTNSTGVTSIKVSLAFDASRLEVVTLDSSQSSFPYQWEQTFDNSIGTIQIQRSSPTPRLGEHLITKITFKTKQIGTATVDYDPNCFSTANPTCLALKPDDTNILVESNTATFTITSQPTPTTPSYGTPSYGTPSYGTPSYGTPSYGTPSYSTPSTSGGNTSDLNRDGKVNIFDLSILLRNWGRSGQGDLNSDGKVNIFDLSILLRGWSK